MIAAFLVLFVALAGCQALLAVKLADWLSPAATTGHGTVARVQSQTTVRLA